MTETFIKPEPEVDWEAVADGLYGELAVVDGCDCCFWHDENKHQEWCPVLAYEAAKQGGAK